MTPSARQPLSAWTVLAAFALLSVLAFSLCDIHLWHPGAAWPDELLTNLALLQESKEGRALPLSFAKGCFHRALLVLFQGGGTSLARLHWPAFAAFFAENLALYAIARRALSERAAAFALLVNAIAAFSILRLRSLLSYSISAAELTLLLALLPELSKLRLPLRPLAALAFGLAASLLLLDYEGWLLALPVLLLVGCSQPGEERLDMRWLALGSALGLATVAGLSWSELPDYFAIRLSHSGIQESSGLQRLPQALLSFVLGGQSLPFAGVSHWGAIPRWAWPGLTAGLFLAWRQQRAWLGWALIGSLPLLSYHSAVEPQRLIIAWPAFCLIGGLGFDAILARGGRAGLALICALLVFGVGSEAKAFLYSQDGPGAAALLPSQQAMQAGRILAAAGPVQVLCDLDNDSGASLRFILDAAGVKRQAGAAMAALVPWEYAYQLEHHGQFVLLSTSPGPAPLLRYYPDAPMASRLAAVDARLHGIWQRLPRYALRQRRRILRSELETDPRMDPWQRSALFEAALGASFLIGEFPRDLVDEMSNKDLVSVSGLLWAVNRIGPLDALAGQALKDRAFLLDPRRRQP